MLDPITLLGDGSPGGAYLLRLRIERAVPVRFGRFCGGRPILVPTGECLYVGSAMKGLGRRLLRHANRTIPNKPHPIQTEMLARFRDAGLLREKERPFPPKRLHWHVDYLLEQEAVTLTHVVVLRSRERLETAVARFLAAQPQTFIFEPGLGANDVPGNTHLLGIQPDEFWWSALPEKLTQVIDIHNNPSHNLRKIIGKPGEVGSKFK